MKLNWPTLIPLAGGSDPSGPPELQAIQSASGFRYGETIYATRLKATEAATYDILEEYLYPPPSPHSYIIHPRAANITNLTKHWDEAVERISKL